MNLNVCDCFCACACDHRFCVGVCDCICDCVCYCVYDFLPSFGSLLCVESMAQCRVLLIYLKAERH